jgi:hypothetical protein
MSFDLAHLLRFRPAAYQCQKCFALFHNLPLEYTELHQGSKPLKCLVCQVEYLPTDKYKRDQWADYLNAPYRSIKLNNVYEHGTELASIADNMRYYQEYPSPLPRIPFTLAYYTPLKALFQALSRAQKFIHFTTYGIHPLLIGALKVTAQRVLVRGIVSGARGEVVSEAVLSELADEEEEALNMELKHYGAQSGYKGMPHQKLLIIDGLLAFKGAANLTLAGWRKAAQGRDVVEVVTNVEEVIRLNNRLFSPIWAELSEIDDTISMR